MTVENGKCRNCDGTGLLVAVIPFTGDAMGLSMPFVNNITTVSCPQCGGTGKAAKKKEEGL